MMTLTIADFRGAAREAPFQRRVDGSMLDRIAQHNPGLNAFVTSIPMARSPPLRAADARIAAGTGPTPDRHPDRAQGCADDRGLADDLRLADAR